MTRDAGSTCQCDNNELAEAKLRIDIYREAWQDAEKETIKLREENERRHSRIVEQNDWLVRLQEENKKLREELGKEQENHKRLAEFYKNLQDKTAKLLKRIDEAAAILKPLY